MWYHLYVESRIWQKWTYLKNRKQTHGQRKQTYGYQRGKGGERDKLGVWVEHIHTQISSVQSLSRVRLFATPWITARQTSLSITNSRSSLRLTSIKSMMPSKYLILCCPLLLPPIPPTIRVFSNESTLRIEVAKILEFQLQHQSLQRTPRTNLL